MDLSICILTHNQPELLPRCVKSCFEEIERAGVDAEVIVVDNASVDGYPAKLKDTYPQLRIIRNEQNLGFSAGNNIGIRASQGAYVLILNDDALLQTGSLGVMLKVIKSDPKIGMVGARLENPDGSPQTGFMHDRYPHVRGVIFWLLRLNGFLAKREWSRRLLTFTRNPDKSGETELAVGACFLACREALFAAGLFDEHFNYLFEDVDLCFQLKKKRWKIFYSAQARVTHYGSSSLRAWSSSKFFRTFVASMLYYFKKDSSRWQYSLLRAVLIPLVLCRMCVIILRDLASHRNGASDLRGHIGILWFLLGGQGSGKVEEICAG